MIDNLRRNISDGHTKGYACLMDENTLYYADLSGQQTCPMQYTVCACVCGGGGGGGGRHATKILYVAFFLGSVFGAIGT